MRPLRPRRSRSPRPAAAALAGLVLLFTIAAGLSAEAPEYSVKAAFLFNLGKFVQWPDTAFSSPGQPLTIGVLGRDPFGPDLERLLANQKTAGRGWKVWRGEKLDPAAPVQILYIADDRLNQLGQVLKAVEGRPVLTVSSLPGFCRQGGMVEFFIQDNRVRLAINRAQVEKARLAASSKLLQLAVLTPSVEEAGR